MTTQILKDDPYYRTFVFGLGSVVAPAVVGLLNSLFRYLFDPVSTGGQFRFTVGFIGSLISLVFSIVTITTGIAAFRAGHRSWYLWLGLIPAMLVGAFWVFMIAGEFIYPH